VNASEAMPAPNPEAEVSLQKSKQDVSAEMEKAEVTDTQLQKANDPRFSKVLTTKAAVVAQADAGPKQYRAGEQGTLGQAVAGAQATGKQGLTALHGVKQRSGTAVKSKQQIAKERDEARRKEVSNTIEKIYGETKQAVEDKLAWRDTYVSTLFD